MAAWEFGIFKTLASHASKSRPACHHLWRCRCCLDKLHLWWMNGAPETSYMTFALETQNWKLFMAAKSWMLKFCLHAAQQRVDQHKVFVPTDVRFDDKNLRLGQLHRVPRNCSNMFKHFQTQQPIFPYFSRNGEVVKRLKMIKNRSL